MRLLSQGPQESLLKAQRVASKKRKRKSNPLPPPRPLEREGGPIAYLEPVTRDEFRRRRFKFFLWNLGGVLMVIASARVLEGSSKIHSAVAWALTLLALLALARGFFGFYRYFRMEKILQRGPWISTWATVRPVMRLGRRYGIMTLDVAPPNGLSTGRVIPKVWVTKLCGDGTESWSGYVLVASGRGRRTAVVSFSDGRDLAFLRSMRRNNQPIEN